MKKVYNLFALCLIILTAWTQVGCAKIDRAGNGREVKFVANANSPQTKAVYGEDAEGYQRIPWQNNDEICIASNLARTQKGASAWTYLVTNVDNEQASCSHISYGTLSNNASVGKNGDDYDTGLLWDDANSEYTFYAMYPATKANNLNSQNGSFSANIPSTTGAQLTAKSQANWKSNAITTLDPTKNEYLMVAKTTTEKKSGVVLEFYPAFTAFQITLYSDVDNLRLESCGLSSTSALSGDFSATISSNGIDPASFVLGANSSNEVSVAFNDNYSRILMQGEGVTFNLFCLPTTLTNLTFYCTFTLNGETKTRRLKLQENGSFMSFAPCLQHRFSLALVSSGGGDLVALTRGGAQMLLGILFNNNFTQEGTLVPILNNYYHVSGPYDFENKLKVQHTLESLQNKIGIWQLNTTHYQEAEKLFDGSLGDGSFTEDELTIIKAFLAGVTSSDGPVNYPRPIGSTEETKITANIVWTDFGWVPNLTSLNIETRSTEPRPTIEIKDQPQLTKITLNQYTDVTISNCGGEEGLVLTLGNANQASGAITLTNVKLKNDFANASQHPVGPVTFTNVSGMRRFSIGNATSVTLTNCPDLETIDSDANNLQSFSVTNAPKLTSVTLNNTQQLTSFSLTDTPLFSTGTVRSGAGVGIDVSLDGCATGLSGNTRATLRFENRSSGIIVIKKDTNSKVDVKDSNYVIVN